ncbi:MAG: hypothetical protein IKS32_01180, partial [Solobacterium sp.]|nr:hypothetical protein [Solobacterium sp.]
PSEILTIHNNTGYASGTLDRQNAEERITMRSTAFLLQNLSLQGLFSIFFPIISVFPFRLSMGFKRSPHSFR